MGDAAAVQEELFDILDAAGNKTGLTKPRNQVHRDGDWHRAVHVWVYCQPTKELLLQQRALVKDSWAGLWDISSAGHVSAGDEPLPTAQRETAEEIGLDLPASAFEHVCNTLHQSIINDGTFVNREHINIYLVTLLDRIPLDAYQLQASEVCGVRYISIGELQQRCRDKDPAFVPMEFDSNYERLFTLLEERALGSEPSEPEQIGVLTLHHQGTQLQAHYILHLAS